MHEYRCLRRPEEGAGFLELKLQVAVSHPSRILGTKLRSSARPFLSRPIYEKILEEMTYTLKIHFFPKYFILGPYNPSMPSDR